MKIENNQNTTRSKCFAVLALLLGSTAFLSAAHANNDTAPNNDPAETWRTDYSDIGYPNVGFSPYIKGWINGYLTPADYPDGAKNSAAAAKRAFRSSKKRY